MDLLDIVEEEDDDDRVELESVGEREEDVNEDLEIVKLESDVEEGSVVNDEAIDVEGNNKDESPVDVGVKVSESEELIEIDDRKEVEGSIVMVESKSEMNALLNSVGSIVGGELSDKVNGNEIGSPNPNVSVSNGFVISGNTSVIVGSPVWMGVGVGMASKEASVGGVDTGKPVCVSDKAVGDEWSSLVENRGIGNEKLKGVQVRKAVSKPVSSSLMEGVDKPQ